MMLRHNSPDWILLFLLPPRCPQSLSLSFKCHDPMNEHPIIYVHNSKTSAFLLSKNKSHQELKPTRALVPSLQFDLHFRKKTKKQPLSSPNPQNWTAFIEANAKVLDAAVATVFSSSLRSPRYQVYKARSTTIMVRNNTSGEGEGEGQGLSGIPTKKNGGKGG